MSIFLCNKRKIDSVDKRLYKTKSKQEQAGTAWNELEPLGISWNHLKPTGRSWKELVQDGSTWNEKKPETN